MNDRIIKMAIQAGFNPVNCTGSNVPLFEKFAELIIEECAQAADTWMEESEGKTFWVGHGVKEHFGIFSDLNEEYRPPVQETHCPHDIPLDKYCKKCDIEVSNQLG